MSGGNPLDRALWDDVTGPDTGASARLALLPFDHDRQLTSVFVDDPTAGRLQITKGAPEAVLGCCKPVPDGSRPFLDGAFSTALRVIAVATRTHTDSNRNDLNLSDETELELAGFVTFLDQPKPDVAESLDKLGRLGIRVKVVTGDNAAVAKHLCDQIGLPVSGALTGSEIAALDDNTLADALANTNVVGRVEGSARRGVAIFADIRRFLRYLSASNTGEVLVMLLGVLFASVLGVNPAVENVMDQPPRSLGGRVARPADGDDDRVDRQRDRPGQPRRIGPRLPGGLIGGRCWHRSRW